MSDKIMPTCKVFLFVFACTLCFVPACFFVLTILPIILTCNTLHQHPCPWRDFFFLFSRCVLYPYFFVLIVLHFAFYPYCTAHNAYIHVPGGIGTRNPSKRSAGILNPPRVTTCVFCVQIIVWNTSSAFCVLYRWNCLWMISVVIIE